MQFSALSEIGNCLQTDVCTIIVADSLCGGMGISFAGIVKCRTSYQQKNDSVYVMILLFFIQMDE